MRYSLRAQWKKKKRKTKAAPHNPTSAFYFLFFKVDSNSFYPTTIITVPLPNVETSRPRLRIALCSDPVAGCSALFFSEFLHNLIFEILIFVLIFLLSGGECTSDVASVLTCPGQHVEVFMWWILKLGNSKCVITASR